MGIRKMLVRRLLPPRGTRTASDAQGGKGRRRGDLHSSRARPQLRGDAPAPRRAWSEDREPRRRPFPPPRLAVVLLLSAARALAAPPDERLIARITGLEPEVKAGVVKVSVPRTALSITVDGVKMDPFQGFTSWAAFQASGEGTIVMGDLALAEDEVSPVMRAALANGLAVTALHNHFAFDHPRVLFMHIDGTGTTERLATAIRKTLDAVQQVRRTPSPAESFGGPAIPDPST